MTPNEVDEIISRWARDDLSSEQFAVLERLLCNDREARKRFLRQVNLEDALREWAGGADVLRAWAPAESAQAPSWRTQTWRMGAVAAVLILCGCAFWLGQRGRLSAPAAAAEATSQGCALLTRSADAVWEEPERSPRAGDMLAPGRLRLKAGLVQIEFFSGALAVIEGPADLHIVSAWEARCDLGAVRFRVPPAARGFRLQAGKMSLVDLGTEFGVKVGAGSEQLRVFEGEVQLASTGQHVGVLRESEGWSGAARAVVDPAQFPQMNRVTELAEEAAQAHFTIWKKQAAARSRDPRLLAQYTFERTSESGWERSVRNLMIPALPLRDGGAVGATWTTGRWPWKSALEFKRPGDRVRIDIEGEYTALTSACWAKVDALDRRYNALLLTDGYEAGEPHWQIFEDGRLMFSVAYPDPANPADRRNQIYYSPPVITPASAGSWHHFSVTHETRTGVVVQYLDGQEISRETSALQTPGRTLVYGRCELGNWGLPLEGHRFPLRNLNGRLDEFLIYSEALSGDEIRELYETGKPF